MIGGNFNMLATDIFKLVIGQQDFPKGAVVAIILLVPVAVTYVVDSYVQKRQSALLSARSVPYVPRPSRGLRLGDDGVLLDARARCCSRCWAWRCTARS